MEALNIILSEPEIGSDSDDSSEEEDVDINILILLYKHRESRQSIENFVEYVVPYYSEKEFVAQFRVGSNVSYQLINQFQQSPTFRNLFSTSGGRQPISAEKHILTFLYFVGHEAAGYRAVNNIFNMSLSTLYCIITRVADFICSLGPQYIKWPNYGDLLNIKAYFQYHKNIPNVVGAIDGSHIIIDKPANDPDSYINRKGNYSIQMQGIVNNEKKFIDVYIGYPGSVHDARVFKNSSIYNNVPQICEGGYILGDSAYPLMDCLLTPFKDNGHLNNQQKNYNNLHSSARIYVEHSFGILKQRFRQLYHLKVRKPKLVVQIIKACCILHNIANMEDINDLEEAAENDMIDITPIEDHDDEEIADTNSGKRIRNALAAQLWQIRNE